MSESDIDRHLIKFCIGKTANLNLGAVKNHERTYKRLKALLSEPLVDTSITEAGYNALTINQKSERKAQAGNWIAGHFTNGIRKSEHLEFRSGISLDLDYITQAQLDGVILGLVPASQYAWFMHTTRAHCANFPRVRVFFPLSRDLNPVEFNAVVRYLSCLLADDPTEGIEIPDSVSFKYNQTMFKPSISKGQDFWTEENRAEILDVDEFLAERPGWDDFSKLPRKAGDSGAAYHPSNKMEDPREKDGIVGAFCRAYDIGDAIETFIPDVYVAGDSGNENRYSYALGSGVNGVVIYDEGRFITSHHGTDPIDGSANAWDMVRIHMFGHLDQDAKDNTSPGNLQSFKAMKNLLADDEAVREDMLARVLPDDWDPAEDEDDTPPAPKKAKPGTSLDDILGDDSDDTDSEIDDILGDAPDEAEAEPEGPKWQTALMLDKQDRLEKSLHNCATLVKNSPKIASCIALNDLDGSPYLRRKLRFPKANIVQAVVDDMMIGRRWSDNDTAALLCALAAPKKMGGFETQFTRQDVELSLLQAAEKNRFNPFLDKVRNVEWDGLSRLKTFFHDWFRTTDNEYHTELAIIWFIAGIARQYEPGHIFDLVPILGGIQGGGKTGAIKALGMGHGGSLSGDYHDTQKMTESTLGKVVLEVAELKGLSKGMIEDVKHYFTAVMDTIRLAYRRNSEDYYRRCVYMGTTNQSHYLRDEENRRFCPVLTNTSDANKIDFENFLPLIPQFWAEAHHLYLEMRKAQPKDMLPLHFTSKAAKAEALRLQTESRETLAHEPVGEVLERWLDTPVADTFDDDDDFDGDELRVRNLVTATMVREGMSDNPIIRDLRGFADKTIAQALDKLEGWESLGQCRRLKQKRRWYARKGTDNKLERVSLAEAVAAAPGPSADDLLD